MNRSIDRDVEACVRRGEGSLLLLRRLLGFGFFLVRCPPPPSSLAWAGGLSSATRKLARQADFFGGFDVGQALLEAQAPIKCMEYGVG